MIQSAIYAMSLFGWNMNAIKKLSVGAGAAVLALAFAVTTGSAQESTFDRKKNFLENLFGTSPSFKKKQTKKIVWQKKDKKRKTIFDTWWQDEDDTGQVRIINGGGDGNRIKRVTDIDPGDGDGFGMGNLTYVAPKLAALGGLAAPGLKPAGAMEGAIYDALGDANLGIRVLPAEKEAIVKAYEQAGFAPFWVKDGKVTGKARAALKVLAAAADEGLDPAAYLPPVLAGFDAADAIPAADLASLARLDLGLTAAALTYARHASGGRFDPRLLSLYNDISPQPVNPEVAVRVLAWSPFADSYLMGLHPSHPAYAALKAELAALRLQEKPVEEPVVVGEGRRVKLMGKDARIPLLRQRLAQLGVAVPPPDMIGQNDVLDQSLFETLKAFQKASKVKPTGVLDSPTVRALGKQVDIRKPEQVVTNMERLRWLPKALPGRYVFVNQAAFKVEVFDGGKEIWESRVIVGKPSTQTSVFNDEIETVVFNPSWGVPPSIMANEYLPKLRADPGYLDQLGFIVTNSKGQRVPSSSVDWWAYGTSQPYSVQQPPGAKNALGELKFLFPNKHDIYMHDTPSRNLFDEDVRAFSYGCVRVQNPREFAQILLGWERPRIDKNTDSKKSQTVKLQRKVPVYLTYFTAWPDETGKIQYFNDIYERDKTMAKARLALTVAQR